MGNVEIFGILKFGLPNFDLFKNLGFVMWNSDSESLSGLKINQVKLHWKHVVGSCHKYTWGCTWGLGSDVVSEKRITHQALWKQTTSPTVFWETKPRHSQHFGDSNRNTWIVLGCKPRHSQHFGDANHVTGNIWGNHVIGNFGHWQFWSLPVLVIGNFGNWQFWGCKPCHWQCLGN